MTIKLRLRRWTDEHLFDSAELQKVFFPPAFSDTKETPALEVGDQRMWTALKIFVELRDSTSVMVPFREASKVSQASNLCD
jgi:hypothetical protein